MQLHCPYCTHDIPATDVNLERMVAKCAACSAVFSFEGQLADVPLARRQLELPLPKGMAVEHQGYELAITRRWLSAQFYFLVFFCLFWDGFLCVWYSIALSQRAWSMAAFALLHTAVGLGLTYYTLAGFLNSTLIRVSPSQIGVAHRPLPWWGRRQIDSSAIAQIFCKERITRGKTTTITYEVLAATHAGAQEKLVGGLPNSDQALYLEQEIERFLNIKDVPVVGELRK